MQKECSALCLPRRLSQNDPAGSGHPRKARRRRTMRTMRTIDRVPVGTFVVVRPVRSVGARTREILKGAACEYAGMNGRYMLVWLQNLDTGH